MVDKKYMTGDDLLTLKTQLKTLANVLNKFQLDHQSIAQTVKAQKELERKVKRDKQKEKFKLKSHDIEELANELFNDISYNFDISNCEFADYDRYCYIKDNHGEEFENIKKILAKAKSDIIEIASKWVK